MKKITVLKRDSHYVGFKNLIRIMKLTAFLILISAGFVFAGETYSQTKMLNLKMGSTTVKEALSSIEDQSEFYFMFSSKIIDVNREVQVDVENKKIDEVLNDLFQGTDVEYTIRDRIIVLTTPEVLSAKNLIEFQQKSVTGKVTNSEGQPMAGVTVVVKGTAIGTLTDANGNYSLTNISEDAILVFSFVGMKSMEIVVSGRTSIDVTLAEELIMLKEVVAIGYGTVKKQDLTGSVSSIKSDVILGRPIKTLSEAFAGKLSGVLAQSKYGSRPGDNFQITIRGINSISAAITPLVVIDGIAGSLSEINPNDIESVEVLKDASSTSIYGARGASGVVLVTTKKGIKGKTVFDVNVSYGLQKVDRIMPTMSRDEWIPWMIYSYNTFYLQAGGSLSTPVSQRGTWSYPETYLTNPESYPDINWQKAILRTAPVQNYEISASGGNDIGSYFISGSYMEQEGIMKYTDYNRMTLRMNTILNVGNNLKIGMNLAPSFGTSNNPMNTNSAVNIYAATMAPIVPLDMNTEIAGYTKGVYAYPNPLLMLEHTKQETKSNKFTSSVWGELNILKDLKFKSQLGYNFYNEKWSYYVPPTYYLKNESGESSSNESYFWSVQNTIEYAPKFSKLFDLSLLLGQSMEGNSVYTLSAGARGYPNELVHTLNVATIRTYTSSGESRNALNSYFGRMLMNARDRYLLTMTIRRDGSSKFGSKTKWGWFPSVSAGWKINNEPFMEKTSGWLDLLKLRALYGMAGNNGIGDYESIASLVASNYILNGSIAQGLVPGSFGNDLLGWETKISKGIGLDLAIFNQRVQANIDFYMDDTKNMLLNVPVSYVSGYSSLRKNIGKIRNKGFEIELTTHNMNGELGWTTSLNFSRNVNEVLKLGDTDQPIIAYSYGVASNITKVGEPISSYYMLKTDGLLLDDDFDETGKPLVPIAAGQIKGNQKIVDISGDGQITADDNTIIGNNMPDFIWGLTNNLNYKNFDLSFFLQGTYGGEIFFTGTRHLDVGAGASFPINIFSRWLNCYKPSEWKDAIPQNMNIDMSWDGKTPLPYGFGVNPRYSDVWLYDASYVRIKNITFGYNLPKRICDRIGLGNAKIFMTGENVFTFTSYPGSVVDSNGEGNSTTQLGADYVTYPLARTYQLGINLKF